MTTTMMMTMPTMTRGTVPGTTTRGTAAPVMPERNDPVKPLAKAAITRSHFPETWLWSDAITGYVYPIFSSKYRGTLLLSHLDKTTMSQLGLLFRSSSVRSDGDPNSQWPQLWDCQTSSMCKCCHKFSLPGQMFLSHTQTYTTQTWLSHDNCPNYHMTITRLLS